MQTKDLLKGLTQLAGGLAVTHFKQSWDIQRFNDQDSEPWPKRKQYQQYRRRGVTRNGRTKLIETKAYKKNNTGRALLIKSGRLRRSIRITEAGIDYVKVGSDVPYAQVHNDGLKAGRGKGFIMPKRKFMGYSRVLEEKLATKIEDTIYKRLKS
jgi:phage gpG-like protein